MATSATDIVVRLKAEVLGPESPFEIERAELRREYAQIIASSSKIVVSDHQAKERAVEHGRLLQAITTKQGEFFKKYKKPIDEVKKVVLDAEKQDDNEVEAEKDRLKVAINKFDAEQAAAQREQQRLDREAAAAQAIEDQLQAAIEHEQAGNPEEAARVLSEAPLPPPVIQQRKSATPVSGFVTGRTKYKARLDGSDDADAGKAARNARASLFALVKSIANGQVHLEYVCLDQKFADKQADAFREGLSAPGLVAYPDKSKSSFRQ